MSHELGRYEELPEEYRENLKKKNLHPLWPSLRAALPPEIPTRKTQSVLWEYKDIRPLLLEAGELTPMEKAERRVLVLANPGHELPNMKATSSIYLGMQLILPGELAPSHRHTPNATRIVVEGDGAHTTVNGEKCVMKRGDLILTPKGMWHEHQHEGDMPVIWLDVLDLPIIYTLESSWSEEGGALKHEIREPDRSFDEYSAAGIVPEVNYQRAAKSSPQVRYPWDKTVAALENMAAAGIERAQVAYVNPETGEDIFPTIGFSALMLRPNETVRYSRRSCATVFHTVDGDATIVVEGDAKFNMNSNDTCCVPGYSEITVANNSSVRAAFFIMADESPLHEYLGIY